MKILFLIFLCIIGFINSSFAQSIRYIDDSGNIHFVDSLFQVPQKYKTQVLAPTPIPTGKARFHPTPRPTPTRRSTPTPKSKLKSSSPLNSIFGKPATPTPQNQEIRGGNPSGPRLPNLPMLEQPTKPIGPTQPQITAPAGVPQGVIAK